MSIRFCGAYTALITPFRNDKLDEDALRDLVERQIAGGITGLVPCGTTGESVTLRGDEHARVVRIVVEQAKKRVPVIAGAGTNSTYKTIELARVCKEAGADALLLVGPYYNKPTQAGLFEHFRTVLREVPMPSIIYNIPGRTGSDISAATFERFAAIPEVVGIKEATGNVMRAQEILAATGDRFDVLSGDDALTLPMMALGGKGVITVTGNVAPGEVTRVCTRFLDGDVTGARELNRRLFPVHQSMFVEANPGPVKAALAAAGRIAPEIRLPLVWPSDASVEHVRAALKTAGIEA